MCIMKKPILFFILACITIININADTVNKLVNGNMEIQGGWEVSYLNTPVVQNPVVTWGYTTNTPANGAGGALHVVATTTSGNSQNCIYQKVTLTQGFVYDFDGAFKSVSMDQSWCEVFIGNIPVTNSDYGEGTGAGQGTLISKFGTWSTPSSSDGTFKLNANNWKSFIPTTSGDYYFVLKMGATTWDGTSKVCDIVIDELMLAETRTKPIVNFTADNKLGFPVMTTTFTNTTLFANFYEWNFGDGSAVSTDTNPVHAYDTPGTYSVTLKATNEVGETLLTKTDFITVNEKPTLPFGELLYGGNMENANFWLVDFLNTGATQYPTATWNNTSNVPAAGAGGCLFVTSNGGGAGIQYAIYQKVSLIEGHVYEFNGAFKDLTTDLHNFWTEVFIGSMPTGGGADYGTGEGTLIGKFDFWGSYTGNRIDGTFKLNASTFNTYTATATGDKYFVAKMGTWDGAGFQIAWDELSLKDLTLLSTGLTTYKPENYKIITSQKRITIEGVNTSVDLYDISGRKIQSQYLTGTFNSKTLNTGLYIINIDGYTTKVSVK